MKPFNLERAIAGDPICFRDGTPCKFIAYVPEALEDQKLIILGENNYVYAYYENGAVFNRWLSDEIDLFMAVKKVKYWVVFHKSKRFERNVYYRYNCKEEADNCNLDDNYVKIGCHEVEFEE